MRDPAFAENCSPRGWPGSGVPQDCRGFPRHPAVEVDVVYYSNFVDLNLLVVLDALLETRSVQDAAARMRLTPSAVSQALSRLRASTDDEILVREGRRMVPTPRALEMHDEVRDVVARARRILTPVDLSKSDRTFVVRCHEALVAALAADLVAAAASEAPHMRFVFVSESASEDIEFAQGHVDLNIGDVPSPSPPVSSTNVGADRHVLVVRRGSALDVPEPTVVDLAAASHVAVSARGRCRGLVDDRLDELGLTRRITASVPTVAAAIAVVAESRCITVLPERFTHDLPPTLIARDMPLGLVETPVAISWNRRHNNDTAHMWVRGVIEASLT